MDDIAHEPRKRKQDADDQRDPQQPPASRTALWPPVLARSFDSPSKRPRRDVGAQMHPPSCTGTPTSSFSDAHVVAAAHPGLAPDNLLRTCAILKYRRRRSNVNPPIVPITPTVPIDLNALRIPALHPSINRQTLKELELESILRNPQLRHNILFDPCLQFRPTGARRKRESADRYWAAVAQEVERQCTCATFDLKQRRLPVICVCSQIPMPHSSPAICFPSQNVCTVRTPSRIRNLLVELLEVLLLVIQPLSRISGMCIHPIAFQKQIVEHSVQAAHIRSIFDPALIEQEMKHVMFDPSGLLRTIGGILKCHCAPMRDGAVELMVQAAEKCAPGGNGTKADAVKAVRMCMEIFELMKIDIANHQLLSLRPFLIRTSGEFELRSLKLRFPGSFTLTHEWLRQAHTKLLANQEPIRHPLFPSIAQRYSQLAPNKQMYLAVMRAIVDLAFSIGTPCIHFPFSPYHTPAPTQVPIIPETLYLDRTRVAHFCVDVADVTASVLLLLLFRQLVLSDPPVNIHTSVTAPSNVNLSHHVLQLKGEIRELSLGHPGLMFISDSPEAVTGDRQHKLRETIMTHIVRHVCEARGGGPASGETYLTIVRKWVDVNMKVASTLTKMVHARLWEAVFEVVLRVGAVGPVVMVGAADRGVPGIVEHVGAEFGSKTGSLSKSASSSGLGQIQESRSAILVGPLDPALAGAEEDVKGLSERLARLVGVHLNAFLPLYEQGAFLEAVLNLHNVSSDCTPGPSNIYDVDSWQATPPISVDESVPL